MVYFSNKLSLLFLENGCLKCVFSIKYLDMAIKNLNNNVKVNFAKRIITFR